MLILYVDTNILMEHEPLDQLPLSDIVGGQIGRVVLPYQVLKEIDRHKYSHDKRLRRRAEKVANAVAKWRADGRLATGVEIMIVRAKSFDYASHDLDRDSQDDRIMAVMIQQSEALPEDSHVLLTADQHFAVLADEFGLGYFLTAGHRLQPEAAGQQAGPRPVLTFPDGATFTELEVPLPPDRQLLEDAAIAKYWTPAHPADASPATGGATAIAAMSALSSTLSSMKLPGHWPQSEQQVRSHAVALDNYARKRLGAVQVSLRLGNDGLVPADDVDVFLEFDATICTPTDEDDLPNYPVNRNPYGLAGNLSLLRPTSARGFEGPWIAEAEGDVISVRYHVKRVKHGMSRDLNTLYLALPDTEHPRSFGFHYAIHSANAAKPTTGELHVRLKSSERLDFEMIHAHIDDE